MVSSGPRILQSGDTLDCMVHARASKVARMGNCALLLHFLPVREGLWSVSLSQGACLEDWLHVPRRDIIFLASSRGGMWWCRFHCHNSVFSKYSSLSLATQTLQAKAGYVRLWSQTGRVDEMMECGLYNNTEGFVVRGPT